MKTELNFMGVRLNLLSEEMLVGEILNVDTPRVFHLCNVHTILTSYRDTKFRACLNNPTAINIVDGKIVEILIRLMQKNNRQFRGIRGKNLLSRVLEEASKSNIRNGIIGANLQLLEEAKLSLAESFPTLQVPVLIAPPFTRIEEWNLIGMAKNFSDSNVKLAWVAVGTPKQDYLSESMYEILAINYVCVGAAIGFLAGELKECPSFVSRIGFEWLFRLIIEPRRLWRRYLLDIPLLIKLVIKELL